MRVVIYVGSAEKDLNRLPEDVQKRIGFGLEAARQGEMPVAAKVLSYFGGATVLELRENYKTDTYRAIYTIRFADALYVLHVFQKKSKRGSETPQRDKELIERRLKDAEADYKKRRRDKE